MTEPLLSQAGRVNDAILEINVPASWSWWPFFSLRRGRGSGFVPQGPSSSSVTSATTTISLDLLRQHSCVLLRGFFNQEEASGFVAAVTAPGFIWHQQRKTRLLGSFDYLLFPVASAPASLRPFVLKAMTVMPEVNFTHAWIQRYQVGHFVNEHRDPGTYQGCVVIAVFGDFLGAVSTIDEEEAEAGAGDVFVLRAHMEGLVMPMHKVSPVVFGTRYIILLTSVADSAADASSIDY